MSSSSSTTSTTPNATSSISPSITQEGSAGFFPPDVVHAAKDVLSSIVGSAMCVYTGQPFDTVKVRMQARPDAFMSPIQCFMTTFREEGLRALWKGSVPALVGAVSENAVAFSVNQQLKRIIADMEGYGLSTGGGGAEAETEKEGGGVEESLIVPFLTGGFTGIFTSAALCPSDVIKCKVQVSRAMLKTGETAMDAKEMLVHVLKQQGIKGLFVGLGAQFARDIPFYAFFFGTYELSLRTLKIYTSVPQEAAYLIAGGLAGVAGWAAVMPIDMAKSIIQTSSNPKRLIPTMLDVSRARGPLALYSGLGVAIFRAFPANAALFLGYELARELLD
ncbi:mitochondrial ornithine transporter 1-like isoform x1 [Nannochloropsis oceanica]